MKPATLQERLSAKQIESSTELKTAVEDAIQAIEAPKKDPRTEREYTFNFRYEDGAGHVYEGPFTTRILTIGQQQRVGILEAQLSGAIPYEALDPAMRNVNHAIAHMTYSLTSTPDWAKDLRTLDDPSLIIQIYMEVASHEARFFGLIKD